MLDLATVNTAIDLLKKLFDWKQETDANRQLYFEQTIRPLYESLIPLIYDYRNAILEAGKELDIVKITARRPFTDADRSKLHEILAALRTKRETFVMPRNTVLGLMHGTSLNMHNGLASNFNEAFRDFKDEVTSLFWADHPKNLPHIDSRMSRAIIDVERVLSKEHDIEGELAEAAWGLFYISTLIERRWLAVSSRYAQLKSMVYRV